MLKYIFLSLFLLIAAVSPATASELRIIDAANGAPAANVVRETALKYVLAGNGASMKRLPGATGLLQLISRNEADILLIDKRFLSKLPDNVKIIPFAAEALCLYIHPGNPSGSLSREEILEILTSPRPRWKNDLQKNVDIQRIMLKSNIAGADIHRRIFGEKNYALEVFRVSSTSQMITFLNPAAIGFGPFIPDKLPDLDFLPVNNIAPDAVSIASGKYPLSLQYVLVIRKNAAGNITAFIAELFSEKHRRELSGYGCIPLLETNQ